jgi:hypothetical protein
MSSSVVCNFSSFCTDCDCNFYHNISLKDRKIVRKLYNSLPSINKNEINSSTRKANCKFGQLCFNPNCGFRHRLSFECRTKLSKAFNDSKLESTKIEKIINPPKSHIFIITDDNVFQSLQNDEDIPIKNPIIIPKTSWADIVGDNDDDFYMKF